MMQYNIQYIIDNVLTYKIHYAYLGEKNVFSCLPKTIKRKTPFNTSFKFYNLHKEVKPQYMIISEQCSTSLDSERKIIGKYDKTETVWAKSSALGEQKSCWFGLVSGAPFLLGQGGPLGERHAFGEHCCSGACSFSDCFSRHYTIRYSAGIACS